MKKILVFLFMAFLFGIVSQANALQLNFDDVYYLGHIDDGIPASVLLEPGYINDLTTLDAGDAATTIGSETYDRIGSTIAGLFPEAVSTGAIKYDGADEYNTTLDATGFVYILAKYDGPNDGSYVWYFDGGLTEAIEVPSYHGKYELSHISAYNSTETVPEPSTMFLLGASLVGLAGIGKKIKK